ncbi:ABC transporter permease [Candidatus Acetothermia bacterium]|nr:ABC transporter permease [Candidatus Acetothermia bacterium]MBI3642595.1 ABC transporter permease [Candidatus Acetothermia bacterium]
MKKALKIALWEFSGTLKNRQFVLFTTIFPILILGFGILASVLAQQQTLPHQDILKQILSNPSEDVQKAVPQFLAAFFAFIFLFVVLFSGTFVLQTIVREKQSRVVEILLAAVSPKDMIVGKILAFGALGIVQTLIWVAVGLLTMILIGPYLGLPVGPLLGLLLAYMPWGKLILFIVYFVLGYLFIASFSAGMGATMTDVLSGQQVQSLIIALPSALPLMLFSVIIQSQDSFLPTLLSYIPPTIAGTMMLRLSVADLPFWEVGLSLIILLASILIVMRLAGKVFEVGILMYGKSASLKEIWRWIRS